jgi:hypothetical protein
LIDMNPIKNSSDSKYSVTPLIRIIGFLFENRIHWQFEVGKKMFTNVCFMLHMYLHANKTLLHNSLSVFDNWGKIKTIDRCSTFEN